MVKPKILFICTHNSARSQMAEGLLRHIFRDKYEVFSAGTNPTMVNPLAIKVLAEIGVDISKHYSKSLDEFTDTEIDLAVSVCLSSAKTLCMLCSSPLSMSGRPLIITSKLHKTRNYVVHGFSDPSEVEGTEDEKIAAFRRSRDEIKAWITDYFADPKIVNPESRNE